MTQRILIGLMVVFGGLIAGSRLALTSGRASFAATAPPVVMDTPPVAPPPQPRRILGPLPAAYEPTQVAGTPAIDLMARLAIRRRIEREGTGVYLDSLLAQTDSTLVRWVDGPTRPLRVRFVTDSVPGALVAAARQGMIAWRSNSAGLAFEEVTDTAAAADIVVRWVETLDREGEIGVTNVVWDETGGARDGNIQLARFTNPDRVEIPVAVIQRVAAHEFGHALGLPHSSRRDDLMHSTSPVNTPSRRDQATLMLLYALPPGSLRTQ